MRVYFNWVPIKFSFVNTYAKTTRQVYLYWYRLNAWYWIGLWVDGEPCQKNICPSSEECSACRKRWRWLDGSPMPEEFFSIYGFMRSLLEQVAVGYFIVAICSMLIAHSDLLICKKGKQPIIRMKTNVHKLTSHWYYHITLKYIELDMPITTIMLR